jgi:transcriptional regulator with XRE-family HTH domain
MAADDDKATKRANDLGPTGTAVAANVARIRNVLGLSTYKLSALLADLGRPISASAITRIEGGNRRVDTDDLMALAVAFDVPPAALLLPPVAEGPVALTSNYANEAARVWSWAEGGGPLLQPPDDDGEYWNAFEVRAKPPGRRRYRLSAKDEAQVAADVRMKLALNRKRPDAETAGLATREFFEQQIEKNRKRRDDSDKPPAG